MILVNKDTLEVIYSMTSNVLVGYYNEASNNTSIMLSGRIIETHDGNMNEEACQAIIEESWNITVTEDSKYPYIINDKLLKQDVVDTVLGYLDIEEESLLNGLLTDDDMSYIVDRMYDMESDTAIDIAMRIERELEKED